jgi:hypothetical protein
MSIDRITELLAADGLLFAGFLLRDGAWHPDICTPQGTRYGAYDEASDTLEAAVEALAFACESVQTRPHTLRDWHGARVLALAAMEQAAREQVAEGLAEWDAANPRPEVK